VPAYISDLLFNTDWWFNSMIAPTTLKDMLTHKFIQGFIDTGTTGIKNMPNLRRRAIVDRTFFINYILVCGYGIGLDDIAIHVYRDELREVDVNADINEMINLVRLGTSQKELATGGSEVFSHGFFQVIPINEHMPRGFHIDVEILHDRTGETGINMSAMVYVKYQEFKTKPNEFGQIEELLKNTRFPR
jgi:hypothetical protein